MPDYDVVVIGAACGGVGDHVKVMEISTPLDYKRRLMLPEGAIYRNEKRLPF